MLAKLGGDGEAERIDEQGEHEALQVRIDGHAELADDERRQQRSGNAAEVEPAEFMAPMPYPTTRDANSASSGRATRRLVNGMPVRWVLACV